MRSNWQIWDFSRSRPQLIELDKKGCYSLWTYDPYLEKLLLNSIPREIVGPFKPILGSEVTPDWIQDNLNTTSLFGEKDSFLILLGEEIPAKSKTLLMDVAAGIQDRYLLIAFGKSSPFFDQLGKSENWDCCKVEPPKFWEQGKLFNYLCQKLEMHLSYDIQSFILENVESSPSSYVNCLKDLKIHLAEKNTFDLDDVKSIITSVRFDKFKTAKAFGQKKFIDCFEGLLDLDYSTLEDFFAFMPNYLTALADTTLIAKKGYKSKYDKEILSFSKLWKREEIFEYIKFFGELLIRARKKDPLLKDILRRRYLLQF